VRTERGFDRLVNFGDAVVAIAITLLVLPLVELHDEVHDQGAVDILRAHRFEVMAFALSFVVIGRLWIAHHRLFESATGYDDALLWLQMAWLLTIAFIPFPTQLLGASENGRAEAGLYIAALTASSACLTVMHHHIARSPALRRADDPELDQRAWVTTALFALAFGLAMAIPGLGCWALLSLIADRPIEVLLRRRDAARNRAAG